MFNFLFRLEATLAYNHTLVSRMMPNIWSTIMPETIPTTDFIVRQKTPTSHLEIWMDVLVTDSVKMGNANTCLGSLNDNVLRVQTSPEFIREIVLDDEAKSLLSHYGGKIVFCGPSGIIAEGQLIL